MQKSITVIVPLTQFLASNLGSDEPCDHLPRAFPQPALISPFSVP